MEAQTGKGVTEHISRPGAVSTTPGNAGCGHFLLCQVFVSSTSSVWESLRQTCHLPHSPGWAAKGSAHHKGKHRALGQGNKKRNEQCVSRTQEGMFSMKTFSTQLGLATGPEWMNRQMNKRSPAWDKLTTYHKRWAHFLLRLPRTELLKQDLRKVLWKVSIILQMRTVLLS